MESHWYCSTNEIMQKSWLWCGVAGCQLCRVPYNYEPIYWCFFFFCIVLYGEKLFSHTRIPIKTAINFAFVRYFNANECRERNTKSVKTNSTQKTYSNRKKKRKKTEYFQISKQTIEQLQLSQRIKWILIYWIKIKAWIERILFPVLVWVSVLI